MKDTIDVLDCNHTVPLSIPFIAKYLKAGRTQVEIARIANVTKQAVNDYIHKRKEIFEPLLDKSDEMLTEMSKLVAIKAQANLTTILDLEPEKKDMIALNAISGTHIDKYRLLSGKPTEIHANTHLIADVNALLEQLKDVK